MPDIQQKPNFDDLAVLAGGRMTSTMLEIALDLHVFARLKGKELSLAEASAAWDLPALSVRVLAQYLCGMGLLLYREGKLVNTPLAETYLVDNASSLKLVRYVLQLGSSAEETKEKLQSPSPLSWYQIRDEGKEPHETGMIDDFYSIAHEFRIRWGEELASRYDFSTHRVLLDVGGASGGWCIGVRKHFPHLQCLLFDIPPACQAARQFLASTGEMADAFEVAIGNFFKDDLPEEADVILLANVLHDWTIEDDRHILRKAYRALPADGVLLVWEFFAEDDWSGSVLPAGHAFSVLGAEGKGGWQPSYGEMEALLQEEGFVDVGRRTNLVIGKKSAG